MKHFIQLNAPHNRLEKILLLTTSEGKEFLPFNEVMRNMNRQGYSSNTIKSYAGHIARFIDYIYEASEHTDLVTPEFIQDAVDYYKSYLLYGVDSQFELVRKIALQLRPAHKTQSSSLVPIGAAIKYFLLLSDTKALAYKQETLFRQSLLSKPRKLIGAERTMFRKASMLAGVLRGGPIYTKRSGGLFGKFKKSPKFQKKPVPFDKVSELIDVASSFRDKAIYSFLAASGARQHETYQIRICDICFEKRSVILVEPDSRDNSDLSEEEYEALNWKGRATERTFLIEPFKRMFFENLMLYIKHERIAHDKHDFLFQKEGGRPYFTTTRQTRGDAFNRYKEKVGLGEEDLISIHSFRHMYGIYTLNYIPIPGGFGLPITAVKVLMGHADLSSTVIYAKKDEEIIKSQIEFANQQVFGLDRKISLAEIRLSYHHSEIKRLMSVKGLKSEVVDD